MHSLRRRGLLLVASVVLAAVPVAFGLIRAVSTGGDDFRYLWLAGAAILGSISVMPLARAFSGDLRVSLGRAVSSVAAGALSAAAIALFMGASAGPGVAIVAVAFGVCSGTSAVFATLARQKGARVSSPPELSSSRQR